MTEQEAIVAIVKVLERTRSTGHDNYGIAAMVLDAIEWPTTGGDQTIDIRYRIATQDGQ